MNHVITTALVALDSIGAFNPCNKLEQWRGILLPPPLLHAAVYTANHVLDSHPRTTLCSSGTGGITLLGGECVGALALSAAIHLALGNFAGLLRTMGNLLDVDARPVNNGDDNGDGALLPLSALEWEVLCS